MPKGELQASWEAPDLRDEASEPPGRLRAFYMTAPKPTGRPGAFDMTASKPTGRPGAFDMTATKPTGRPGAFEIQCRRPPRRFDTDEMTPPSLPPPSLPWSFRKIRMAAGRSKKALNRACRLLDASAVAADNPQRMRSEPTRQENELRGRSDVHRDSASAASFFTAPRRSVSKRASRTEAPASTHG